MMYPEKAAILGPFFHLNAGFFMGLYFVISTLFLPAANESKGAALTRGPHSALT